MILGPLVIEDCMVTVVLMDKMGVMALMEPRELKETRELQEGKVCVDGSS